MKAMNTDSLRKAGVVAAAVIGSLCFVAAVGALLGWLQVAHGIYLPARALEAVNAWIFPSQLPAETAVGTLFAAVVLLVARPPSFLPMRPRPRLVVAAVAGLIAVVVLWTSFPAHAFTRQGPLDLAGAAVRLWLTVALVVWGSEAFRAIRELVRVRHEVANDAPQQGHLGF
ncbi:hypothetical protein [Mycolicibacterium grossiae]|nr:hypothetical protein [Mycolicibacterium grossiae]